jgi:hypothetical protein
MLNTPGVNAGFVKDMIAMSFSDHLTVLNAGYANRALYVRIMIVRIFQLIMELFYVQFRRHVNLEVT